MSLSKRILGQDGSTGADFGYDEEEWDTFPDETKQEIRAEANGIILQPGSGACGCAGGREPSDAELAARCIHVWPSDEGFNEDRCEQCGTPKGEVPA